MTEPVPPWAAGDGVLDNGIAHNMNANTPPTQIRTAISRAARMARRRPMTGFLPVVSQGDRIAGERKGRPDTGSIDLPHPRVGGPALDPDESSFGCLPVIKPDDPIL